MIEAPAEPPDRIRDYTPGASITAFHASKKLVRVLIGGRGCVHGDTRLYDPVNGTTQTFRERAQSGSPLDVLTMEGDHSMRVSSCEAPFLAGKARLYRVRTRLTESMAGEGRPIHCAADHRFVTPTGWQALRQLQVGDTIMSAPRGASLRFEPIVSIEWDEEESDYYDLTVPYTENYWAENTIHHNSGKTYGLAADIFRHIFWNAGAKAVVARHTETSNVATSIDTFKQFFEDMGDGFTEEGSNGLFKLWANPNKFRIPSKLAIERMQAEREAGRLKTKSERQAWIDQTGDRLCGTIEFKGLPDITTGESKLRGMECSYLALVEADQIERRFFDLSFACLRWKGADPKTCDEKGYIVDKSLVLDTNPPGTKHWIALLEAEEKKKQAGESSMEFWHIPTDENSHNLPANYIRDQIMVPYANNPPMIARMRRGEYADAYDGSPVFYAYQISAHEAQDIPWTKGAYLVRSYDQGNPNATIFAAYWEKDGVEYWHDLYEIVMQDSDADRQSKQALQVTDEEFPYWNDRTICAGVLDFCDPAYTSRSGTMKIEVNKNLVDMSQLAVFRKNGIHPGMRTASRGLQETIAVMNRLLQKRDGSGRYVYQIDTKGCPNLTNAMRGGYRYPSLGEPGWGKNEPLKGPICDGLDAVADASRYGKINCLRLLQAEMNGTKPPLFDSRKKKSMNPTRKL